MLKRTIYVLGSRVICVTLHEFSKMPTVKPSDRASPHKVTVEGAPGLGFCHSIHIKAC